MFGARRDNDVFLNIPFDDGYEKLFVALIAGLTGLGLNPRCVLEIPQPQFRLERLRELILVCGSSIHDLSRVEVDRKKPRAPRFNMPFELGLTVGVAFTAKSHRWIVLEEQPFRVQKSCSDLNGIDPYIHNGSAVALLECLRQAFVRRPQPSLAELRKLHYDLQTYLELLRAQGEAPSVFTATAFRELNLAAHEFRRLRGLHE